MKDRRFLGMVAGGLVGVVAGCGSLADSANRNGNDNYNLNVNADGDFNANENVNVNENSSEPQQVTLEGQLIAVAWDDFVHGVGGVDYSFETTDGRNYDVSFERPGPYISGQATVRGTLTGDNEILVCDGCLEYRE